MVWLSPVDLIYALSVNAPAKTNEWELLAEKAEQRGEAADLLLENEHWENALEQAHLCLELGMKAALERAGKSYPTGAAGHDLAIISKCRIEGHSSILSLIRSDSRIRPLFTALLSAWRMQYRYQKIPLDLDSIVDLVGYYRRVYRWIESRFLT